MSDPVIQVSQLIHCPVEQAFDAFADPAKITQFWLDSTSGQGRTDHCIAMAATKGDA